MKLLSLLGKIAATFFIVIFTPILNILQFIIFKILVKIYLKYYSFIKKIGWNKLSGSFLSFIFGKKTVHVLLLILTMFITFNSLVEKTKAKTSVETSNKRLIAKLVDSEFGDIGNDELIEETFNEETLSGGGQLKYLNNVAVLENKLVVSTDPNFITEETKIIVDKDIDEKEIRPIDLPKTRTSIITYKVKPGDTISTIAQNFDISVNTILWENNLNSHSLIRPGDNLSILPGTGVMHKVASGENLSYVAKKYSSENSVIMKANKITSASTLLIGQELFIPDGRKIYTQAETVKPTQVAYNPITIIKDVVKPADSNQSVPSNKMAWPTEGSRITQYYKVGHLGLDIANKTGTPLYAADAGTVTYSGWSNGYGNRVDIDHGGGKLTRYAHASKIYVKNGQKVSKGETIADMGSTGWSTGPHIHFEVIINGKKYNPLNYITK